MVVAASFCVCSMINCAIESEYPLLENVFHSSILRPQDTTNCLHQVCVPLKWVPVRQFAHYDQEFTCNSSPNDGGSLFFYNCLLWHCWPQQLEHQLNSHH